MVRKLGLLTCAAILAGPWCLAVAQVELRITEFGDQLDQILAHVAELSDDDAAVHLEEVLSIIALQERGRAQRAALERLREVVGARELHGPWLPTLQLLAEVYRSPELRDPSRAWVIEEQLARVQAHHKQHEQVLLHTERALAWLDQLEAPHVAERAIVRLRRSRALVSLGRHTEAAELLRPVVDERHFVSPVDHAIACMELAGAIGQASGNWIQAARQMEEAVDFAEKNLPPGHNIRTQALRNLAGIWRLAGDLEASLRADLRLAETHPRRDIEAVVDVRSALLRAANSLAELGRFQEAIALYQRVGGALAARRPPWDEDLLISRRGEWIALHEAGWSSEALRLLRETLDAAAPGLEPGGDTERRIQRDRLVLTSRWLGQSMDADRLASFLDEEVEDREMTLGPMSLRNMIAVALLERGQAAEALEHLDMIVQRASPRLLSGRRGDAVRANRAAALALLEGGGYADLLAAAEGIREPTSTLLRHLCLRADAAGDLVAARSWAKRALDRAIQERRPALTLLELAGNSLWTEARSGSTSATAEALDRFAGRFERVLEVAAVLSPSEQARLAADLYDEVDLLLHFADHPAGDVRRVWSLVEAVRWMHSMPSDGTRPARGGEDVARDLQDAVLANWLGQPAGRSPVDLLLEREAEARQVRADTAPALVSSQLLDEALCRLEPGESLVAYWPFRTLQTGAGTERRLMVFLMEAGGEPALAVVPGLDAIEQRIQAWRATVLATPGVDDAAARRDALGAQLVDEVWSPVWRAIGPSERCFVLLPGAMAAVPWSLLPRGPNALGAGVTLMRLATVAGLLPESGERQRELVVVGDIDYGEASAPTDASPVRSVGSFPRLLHSAVEMRVVEGLWERATGQRAVHLSGTAATRAAVVDAMGMARVLHLSTHCIVADEDPVETRAALGLAEGRERPLLAPRALCGLVLSGAHAGEAAGAAQGLLTGEQISAIDMSGCELVVLAGCGTAQGLHPGPAGVVSLQTSFLAAGARRIIASLWGVDDEATRRFMETFYSNLWPANGELVGVEQALWRTQRAMRSQRVPLRHWAGWVLVR